MADEDDKNLPEDAEDGEDQTEGSEGDGEEEGEEGAKKKGKKKVIMLAGAGAILLGSAIGAIMLIFTGGSEEEVVVDPAEVEPEQIEVAFYDFPQVSANLLSDGRVNRYIKLTLSLELANETDLPRIQQLLPRIQDDFQTYLRQLRVEDLSGSAGIFRLKEGLLRRARQSAAPIPVRSVLIKDMVVQ